MFMTKLDACTNKQDGSWAGSHGLLGEEYNYDPSWSDTIFSHLIYYG